MLFDGILVHAKVLVNGSSVIQMTELDPSGVLFPRQLPTETLQRLNALEEVWVERNRAISAAIESV